MKKLLVFILLALLTSLNCAFATEELHTIRILKNGTTDSFDLSSIATRTEYRMEQVNSTCYEQVFDGYRTVCDSMALIQKPIPVITKNIGPHPAPDPHPRDPRDPPVETKPGRDEPRDTDYEPREPQRRCYEEAVYREVSYSCVKTVSVPYEVFDHYSHASVNVKISAMPSIRSEDDSCNIIFKLSGDSLIARNTCQEFVAIAHVGKKEKEQYKRDYNYLIDLYEADKVFAPLAGKLENMRVQGDFLYFKTGNLIGAKNFALKLFVKRNRFLRSDLVLINRQLKPSEFSYQAQDEKTGFVKINLSKLIGELNSKKYTIHVGLDLSLPEGELLMGTKMPKLRQENSLTVKK